MGRWEPDGRGRLQRAAMELFIERGYDDVSVADIGARAGLARRSFYNHFADKSEVMFAAADDFQAAVLAALVGAELEPTPLDAVIGAFDQAAQERIAGHRELARARQRLIEGSPELQERDLVKTAALIAAVAAALYERGMPARSARYVAHAASVSFSAAVDEWARHSRGSLSGQLRASLRGFRAALSGPSARL